jgi:hypothetical protein
LHQKSKPVCASSSNQTQIKVQADWFFKNKNENCDLVILFNSSVLNKNSECFKRGNDIRFGFKYEMQGQGMNEFDFERVDLKLLASLIIDMRSTLKNFLFVWEARENELALIKIGCNLPDRFGCFSELDANYLFYFLRVLDESDVKSKQLNRIIFNKLVNVLRNFQQNIKCTTENRILTMK